MKANLYVLFPMLISCAFFGFWQRSILAAFAMMWVFLTVMALLQWHAGVLANTWKEMWEEHKKVNKDFREHAEAEEVAARIADSIYSWDTLQKQNPEEFKRMWSNRKSPTELSKSIDNFLLKPK